ncbi:MAG: HINT domain-containing protein, partial [Lachnospiraceae bacterium]|nr:HINT domain-containing protein [Lachnospiraceae bacterium]
ECEKSGWEKFCDGLKKVCDWCAEHWKLLATIAIVAIAIAVLFIPGIGPIISGACWGAIFGALLGGLSGGIESVANGGSFLKGFEDGAFSGAISGAIMGGAMAGLGVLGQVAGKGMNAAFKGMACLSKFGRAIKTTAVVTKVMSYSMMGFDLLALGDKAFGFAGGKIAALNTELHKSKAYNYFQLGVSAVAAFTGGMSKTMKCFVAGTLVLTANGLVAIENIKAGDMVYSADEKDPSKKDFRPVLETYVRKTDKLVHLVIGGREVVSTYDHPFYVNGQGFVTAVNLCIGSELVDSEGKILRVEGVYHEELHDGETRTVYNFQVDEYHTYHIDANAILVHNASDYSKFERMGKQKGKSPRDQQKQQEQVRKITRELKKLGVPEGKIKDQIHDILHNEGLGFQEALQEAKSHFGVD